MSELETYQFRKTREDFDISQSMLSEATGLSIKTISRADQGNPLSSFAVNEICNYLSGLYGRQVSAEELGLKLQKKSKTKLGDNKILYDDLKEPLFTSDQQPNTLEPPIHKKENANTSALSPAIPTFPIEALEDTDTLNRLQKRTLGEHLHINEATLALLEKTNKNNWCLYALFENSILYRRDMLYGISGELQTITNLMEYPQPNLIHNRLSSLACDTIQLMGEIFFDLKDSHNAKKHYNTAIAIARESHNNLSLAITLGRMSFISLYDDDPQKALDVLQTALARLPQQAPDVIRVWLLTRQAEAYAILYNIDHSHKGACLKALDNAELYLNRSQNGENPAAFSEGAINAHMNISMFRGYQGACYTHLKLPTAAQKVLHADLTSAESTQDIHNAIIRVDLAKTYVQQKEIEEAYKYINEALLITSRLKSARVLQRILTLLDDLEPWKNTWYVKDLNEQVALLLHSIIHTTKGKT